MGLFLALAASRDEIQQYRIREFCSTRKCKNGKPTITASGTNTDKSKRWAPWHLPKKIPSKPQVRSMVILALKISIRIVLQNHIFKFNGKLYQQNKGGAIGVGLAGEVANLFMVWWDRQFKIKLENENIPLKMYSRYVDDIETVVKAVQCESGENDKATMEKLQILANSIHPSIKVTIAYPSESPNRRMPVLDLEQWMDEIEINGQRKQQIIFSHYMKPVSNRKVIGRHSALSMKFKYNILVSDLVRIMRNISPNVEPKERVTHVQYFINRMQASGYNGDERMKVYNIAKNKFEKMKKEDEEGTTPLYRSKQWNRNSRDAAKSDKKKNWFKQGGYETVFFIDATPNSVLAKDCQKIFKELNLNIRVVEEAGTSMKQKLVKSYPFPRENCKRGQCTICDENMNINCKKRDVVYEVRCNTCDSNTTGNYVGETSRSLAERYNEHVRSYKERENQSIMLNHTREKHNGIHQRFDLKVLGSCPGDAMLRQNLEAVYIRENAPDLNQKDEWGNSNVPRARKSTANASLQ